MFNHLSSLPCLSNCSQYQFVCCCCQGITLKVNDDGCCIVARIMHGGMIHKQGLFTVVPVLSMCDIQLVTMHSVHVGLHVQLDVL